ncbi:precorrin-3B C(17)-methyltransferase [Iningainema sp. BLCCT55]|uniref:Precorrin-3B C(17)-methyltransferase n=2 Tax=Iningainema TaxID=1932705 RepID=A0A8J7C994_9CYAN|nr:precorrin-3B C(17)-methyltransferase [Iningainema tapete]MBD2777854.1 precorrin-3B C(17)-methyltransferase [Iningainema tapete BLCC-T55]
MHNSPKVPAAIIILNQNSVSLARQMITVVPATLYGLAQRTSDVDVSFTDFGSTLRELFTSGTPIIGICAAGILIRTLAPVLSDKRQEPPVLAVAEDGSAVVPLLGGLQGVNDLARQIAAVLQVQAAITTTGDIRFRTALLAPPQGYHLANPDDAKGFISDLLAGATVKLEGTASWLVNSKLPFDSNGRLMIRVTEYQVELSPNCLVYHPATLAIGVSNARGVNPDEAVTFVRRILVNAGLSPASLAGVFAWAEERNAPAIDAIANSFNIQARFLDCQDAVAIALAATGASELLVQELENGMSVAIATASDIIDTNNIGQARGQLFIVGTGPGAAQWMSPEVKQIISEATDLVGYRFYLDLAGTLKPGQRRHEFDNREELARAEMALDLAAGGRKVAIVSSGDPGIYAMAAAVFEVLDSNPKPEWQRIKIQVAPGISAIQAAAARIGAPIGHDFCVISLSDILKPWSVIESRIIAASKADFVIAFYNPASKQRTWQLASARDILLRDRSPQTPVVLARNLGRVGESVLVRTLAELSPDEVDMRTLVLIGSTKTRIVQHSGGIWVYTPRQYE